MVNQKLVYKIIGSLLFIEAMMMLCCLVMALCYREDDVMSFLISMAVTLTAAFTLRYFGRDADNSMGRRDAYLVVTLTWVVFSAFGAMPFLVGGFLTNPADAYFETMSGFTTTGASVIDNVEALPHGILFWRSFTHWIGGLGIVFFTIAILPSLVGGNVKVFAAEATGPIKSKLHPRLSTTAKWIWMVYIVLTTSSIVSLWLAGMSLFDSVNYSMAATATGGFSTHNTSVLFFHSPSIEYICTLVMFLSGMNFTLIYLSLFKGRWSAVYKDSEFKIYLTTVLLSSTVIAFMLVSHNGYDAVHAVRSALFQVVSFITTTGFYSDDAGLWPHITWIVLSICMFFGACAGSTSGGFKCIRVSMVLKVLRNEFRHILHPRALLPVKINGQCLHSSAQSTLLAFFTLYILLCLFASIALICMGTEVTSAITISLSSISNVGPALGRIGPTMSWHSLPDAGKWIRSALMLMGRLEIFSVLVLFTPSFWKDN